jgi:SAM-dependent methyltransferase
VSERFREIQRSHFEEADVERFRWTTRAPGFAETEDALLEPLLGPLESPCLEIGCGEGNNLLRLARHVRCLGVDLFPKKLHFAASTIPRAGLAASDAAALPLADASVRSVFVRDLLHHVPDPAAVLAEAVRVLAPGGALLLLEPNGRNPLVRLQTHLVEAERGARRFGVEHVSGLLRPLPLRDVEVCTRLPLPLRRTLLHYRYGLPALGRRRIARELLAGAEDLLGRLVPRARWSYVVASARRT